MKAYSIAATLAIAFVACVLLFGDRSPWISTTSGAIHADAYDFVSSHIGIHTAFKQDGVCKDYVNELNDTADAGINGAVEDASYYSTLDYYYYKTESYMEFHKDVANTFTLTLSKSPIYLRLPRVIPSKQVVLDKFQNLSLATQVQITSSLLDKNGNPKQFTAKELADLIEKTVGKQEFDLTTWVVSNFFDQDQQKFLDCVPDINKLVENPYGPAQQKGMRDELVKAEGDARATIRKIGNTGILSWF